MEVKCHAIKAQINQYHISINFKPFLFILLIFYSTHSNIPMFLVFPNNLFEMFTNLFEFIALKSRKTHHKLLSDF